MKVDIKKEVSKCVDVGDVQEELENMALAEEESDCEMYCIQPITIQVPVKGFKAFQDLEVPCGKCIGCRIAKRKEWSLRMLHELTYHPQSSFITLTYDDYNLP